ncbi:MAG TPA: MerR family DNA-binding transcriptional regulator [Stellaceae bacterium]
MSVQSWRGAAAEIEAPRLYSIGDLAGEFALSARAIRFYEDHGLLSPQRIGGNRVYGARDRARLQLILRGKRLGFALADIKELLDLYDVDPDHLEQLRATLAKGRERIAELERQQQEIALTLRELRDIGAHIEERIRQKEATPRAGGRKGTAP